MFSLTGRVTVVTGGSRGLGFAMAEALARNGAHVIITGRDLTMLRQAAVKIGAEALAFEVCTRVLMEGTLTPAA